MATPRYKAIPQSQKKAHRIRLSEARLRSMPLAGHPEGKGVYSMILFLSSHRAKCPVPLLESPRLTARVNFIYPAGHYVYCVAAEPKERLMPYGMLAQGSILPPRREEGMGHRNPQMKFICGPAGPFDRSKKEHTKIKWNLIFTLHVNSHLL